MSDHISVTRDGAVMRIAFNRPEKKNAITTAMYEALADGLAEAERDNATKAILLEARGDIFTAGNDISDFMAGMSMTKTDNEVPGVVRFLETLATADKPVIAAVQGPAVGIGVTLLLHCDLVYASKAATFHTPFVDLALIPEAASSLLLPRIVGHQRAAEMLFAGKKIDAARAYDFGFINEVVASEALEQVAMDAARAIAEKAPASMKLTKKLVKGDRKEILERMHQEFAFFAQLLQSDEFREAGMAFMEKRKPDFSKLG